jgi:hypothetical protein
MYTLKIIIALFEGLGSEMYMDLLDPKNFKAVRELVISFRSGHLDIGGRVYDILLNPFGGFVKPLNVPMMIKHARNLGVHLGEEDGRHILEHSEDIVHGYRDILRFFIIDWHNPDNDDEIAYIHWDFEEDRLVLSWKRLEDYDTSLNSWDASTDQLLRKR